MANRDLFTGADYKPPGRTDGHGRWLGRLFMQGLAALALFGGVVYLYEQEGALAEGVRYVVALASADRQEAMAVNGLADFWRDLTADASTPVDNPTPKADEENAEVPVEGAAAPADAALPLAADYQPDADYTASSVLRDDGEPVLVLPVSGLMQSAFGELNDNGLPVTGLEIFCQQEQAVKAAAIGEVTNVQPGKQITLKHSGGIETVYSGKLAAEVTRGDILRQGDVIGRISEGVLLFQVLLEGEPQDPLLYVLGPE